MKHLDETFGGIQLMCLGLTIFEVQSAVIMTCSVFTFMVYLIINHEKIEEFFKKFKK